MEEVPWLTITAAGGGWTLFGGLAWLVLRGMLSGTLLTRREADAMEKRIETQQSTIDELTRQNGLLVREALPLTNSVLSALKQAAEAE